MAATERSSRTEPTVPVLQDAPRPRAFMQSLAVARIATGWIFLWSFLDSLFGLGFSTERGSAWIDGASPASGWLEFGTSGPLAPMFQAMAGNPVIDVIYMIAMLGIGLALMLGIGLRVNAVLGGIFTVAMWAGSLPPENNPFMTYHLLYVILFVVFALGAVGHVWGLGRRWAQLEVVQRNPWLK